MGDRGQVVRSAEIRNAPRRFLQPPFLTPRTLKQITVPMSELVLDVLRPDGRRLDSFGWPWTAEAFFDRPLGDVIQGLVAYESIRIGRSESILPLRALRVPVAPSAAFLLFSQSVASPGTASAPPMLQRFGRALYSLAPAVLARPDLPDFASALPVDSLPGAVPVARPPSMRSHGRVVDTRTIVDNGDPARRFDIVILGEGFPQSQLRRFDETAKLLADRLLAMPPFAEVADLINVHTVRTASTDRGVSQFPDLEVKKKTFYGVVGHFDMMGAANAPRSFLGTHVPETILAAAERIAPLETLELFIVLVNVKALAASAFPDQQLAFTSLHHTHADLVDYTAHECGHAIARTAEEYQDQDGPTPGRTYLNRTTEKDRRAGTVWWKTLAKPSELDAKGGFKAVHEFGDPNVHFTRATQTPVFDKRRSRNGMLGLYWGCQDINPALPGKPDPFQDARGREFYRAMATCKMRNIKSPFCRVCSALIFDRIRAAAL
jgi:IgA Peptidase M64